MQPEDVKTRSDLVRFLTEMSRSVNSFENQDLSVFLEAASAWLADTDGYFLNRGEEVPSSSDWSLLASVLAAARRTPQYDPASQR